MITESIPFQMPVNWTEDLLRQRLQPFHSTIYSWNNLTGSPLNDLRKAAILVPLTIQDGEIYVWLTKRSHDLSHDKGCVSFPGGMKDDTDETAIDTCLREAREEIGLMEDQVTILSEHHPLINERGMMITIIVGLVSSDFVPKLNPEEVLKCFTLPLKRFLSRESHYHELIYFLGEDLQLDHFTDVVEGDEIHTYGMTATVLMQIAVVLFQRMPEFSHEEISLERPFAVFEDRTQFFISLPKNKRRVNKL